MAIPRRRPYAGPALFSYGFRPFFLFGALWAAAAMALWIAIVSGVLEIPGAFAPPDWHIHEMLFGYLAAVIAGFLLTAIPNWTGRLPLNGVPLICLSAVWVAGRAAMLLSAKLGVFATAIIDCAFLMLLLAAVAREIIAGSNWRNLKVLVPAGLFLCANILFHTENALYGHTDLSRRLAFGAAIMLIEIIGGRIIPSFTRNWLAQQRGGPFPASFGRFDVATLTVTAMALLGWIVSPALKISGYLLLLAAAMNLFRLLRWHGGRTIGNLLVFILHLGFFWLPVGLALTGAAILTPDTIPAAAAFHALAVGAIGTMTLAVMVRATLGHTGQPLEAGWRGALVFAAITIAAVTRVAQALAFHTDILLHVSATAWILAFLGFALLFGRAIMTPRLP